MQKETEGGVCYYCLFNQSAGSNMQYMPQQQGTNWKAVLANIGTGLAVGALGYKMHDKMASRAADAGHAYYPNPGVASYGAPFLLNGMYGALGGAISGGAYGCAGTMGGYGQYGAGGMMNPMMMMAMMANPQLASIWVVVTQWG